MASAVHTSQPSYVLSLSSAFIVLCPLVVGLGFFTRVKVNQHASLGPDDWLTVPAALLTVGCAAVLIFGVRDGTLAHNVGDDPTRDFTYCQQLQWAFLLMHVPAIGFTKLSFVLFFRRVFCVTRFRTPFEITSAIIGSLIVLWTLAFFFWFLFSCGTHFNSRWTSFDTYLDRCGDDNISDIGLSISNFLTDIIVLILPIPMIWKLHLDIKGKLMITGVFALGVVALVVSTIRMIFFFYIIIFATNGDLGILHAGTIFPPGADNNLLTTETLYWSLLEQGLALVACCLPTLNSLFTSRALRSFIASARSLQNLSSRRSCGTEASAEQVGQTAFPRKPATNAPRNDSAATAHDPWQHEHTSSTKVAIRVDRSIDQTSELA